MLGAPPAQHRLRGRHKVSELNYMAIDEHGKFVAVASPKIPKADLAKELSKWIRWGCSVERCDDDYVRKNFGTIIRTQAEGEGQEAGNEQD